MNLHKHQLYLLEQHNDSFKIWSAIIRINTKGKSLIMKLGAVVYSRHSIWFTSFVLQVFVIGFSTAILYYTSILTSRDIRTPGYIQITSWIIFCKYSFVPIYTYSVQMIDFVRTTYVVDSILQL